MWIRGLFCDALRGNTFIMDNRQGDTMSGASLNRLKSDFQAKDAGRETIVSTGCGRSHCGNRKLQLSGLLNRTQVLVGADQFPARLLGSAEFRFLSFLELQPGSNGTAGKLRLVSYLGQGKVRKRGEAHGYG